MRLFFFLSALLILAAPAAQAASQKTVLAAGCFWSMQKMLDHAPGVTDTTVGYAGGDIEKPTYQNYHDGDHPHVEAVEVTYDTDKTSYADLLAYYFRHIDPTDGRGQFCDFGAGYKPAIFVTNAQERTAAEAEKARVAGILGKPVAVAVRDAGAFWPAEDYHQDYYIKNPVAYERYRIGCGRDAKLKAVWDGHE